MTRKERLVLALNEVLFAMLGSPSLVDRWWHSPNKAFDGNTPWAVLDTDPKAVQAYINKYVGGDYS